MHSRIINFYAFINVFTNNQLRQSNAHAIIYAHKKYYFLMSFLRYYYYNAETKWGNSLGIVGTICIIIQKFIC